MSRQFTHHELIRWAGLFTWACVAVPLLVVPFHYGPHLDWYNFWVWCAAQLTFGAAYWALVRRTKLPGFDRLTIGLLTVMSLSALAVSHYSESGLGGILMLIIAGLLPWVASARFGAIWLVAQNILLAVVFARFPENSLTQALIYCGLYLGFSSFTFAMSLVAMRETEARRELRTLNSELRATQELLAESSRIGERVRISRELHDLLGHHLTALSLNLEIASHVVEGKAKHHVERSRALSKLLLADVREVVGQMRHGDELDLSAALATLINGVPKPRVTLDMPKHLTVKDPERAQVLLRCVQEMITNAVRHSEAENLTIRFEETAQGLRLWAQDDGRGSDSVSPGHGLTGMNERLKQLGGQLKYDSRPGAGFRLHAWLPLEKAA